MNLGWLSASPTATTGYGGQTLEVCDRLMERHNVVCIGQTGDLIVWGGRQRVDTPSGKKLSVVALSDWRSAADLINSYYIPEYSLDLVIGFMDCIGGDTPLVVTNSPTKSLPRLVEVQDLIPEKHPLNVPYYPPKKLWVPSGKTRGWQWTCLNWIAKKKTTKPVLRVFGDSVVDVTSDHRFLSYDAEYKYESVWRIDRQNGPKWREASLLSKGKPRKTKTIFPSISNITKLFSNEGGGDYELGFIYGLFAADGGAYPNSCDWGVFNRNEELLDKTCSIFQSKFTHLDFDVRDWGSSKSGAKAVVVYSRKRGDKIKFIRSFREKFYTKLKHKKVPNEVLNGNPDFKRGFIDGFYAGDSQKSYEFLAQTKYKILALGVSTIFRMLDRVMSCSSAGDYIAIYLRQKGSKSKLSFRSSTQNLGQTDGYVYDINTDAGQFVAGTFKVHNCFGIEFLNNVNVPVVGWIPIDGPFTGKWKNYVRNFHRVIAYSRFGYGELQKWFPPTKIGYIPHGVSEEFRPLDKDEIREEFEEEYGIPKEAFLAVNVGANVGPRKELPLMMRTFKRFVEDGHDDAYLFMHTNAHGTYPRAYDLPIWRAMLGMEEHVLFPDYNPIISPVSNAQLARVHNAGDVYWQNSVAEGFGLPEYEAMSCGIPVICPRNSAQVEIVEGNGPRRGWLVESVPEDVYVQIPVYVPHLSTYPVPDQRSALEKLEEAYHNPDLREKYGRAAKKYVEKYHNWDLVMDKWFKVLNEVESELDMFQKIGGVLRA